jgi:hypothetical protein
MNKQNKNENEDQQGKGIRSQDAVFDTHPTTTAGHPENTKPELGEDPRVTNGAEQVIR